MKRVQFAQSSYWKEGQRAFWGVKCQGGGILCMTRAQYYTSSSHTRLKGSGEEISVDKEGGFLVMDPPAPCLRASSFYQPSL